MLLVLFVIFYIRTNLAEPRGHHLSEMSQLHKDRHCMMARALKQSHSETGSRKAVVRGWGVGKRSHGWAQSCGLRDRRAQWVDDGGGCTVT